MYYQVRVGPISMLFAAAIEISISPHHKVNKHLAQHIGETWNTANPLHVLPTPISKDSHIHNPHGVDETCVRLRYANRTYSR